MVWKIDPSNDSRLSAALACPRGMSEVPPQANGIRRMPSGVPDYKIPNMQHQNLRKATSLAVRAAPRPSVQAQSAVSYKPARRGSNSGIDHGDCRNETWTTTNQRMSEQLDTQAPTGTAYEQAAAGDGEGGIFEALKHMGAEDRSRLYNSATRQLGADGATHIIEAVREKVQQKVKSAQDLRRAFRLIDSGSRGVVDPKGLCDTLATYGVQLSEMHLIALVGAYDNECTGAMPYGPFVDDVVAERVGLAQSRRRSSIPGTMTMACGGEAARHIGGNVVTVQDGGRTRHILASNTLGQHGLNQLESMARNCGKANDPDVMDAEIASFVKYGRRASIGGSAVSQKQLQPSAGRSLYFDKSRGVFTVQAI